MTDWLQRSELLVKKEGLETLKNAKVLVVGLGGVGSFAAEFLARAGVGNMTIVDGDIVDITNSSCEILYVKLIKYIVQGLIIGSISTSKLIN